MATTMQSQLFYFNNRLSNGGFFAIKGSQYHLYYDCFEMIENKIAKMYIFQIIAEFIPIIYFKQEFKIS